MRSSMGCFRPGKRRRSTHVGILFRLQEDPVLRQPRRQTAVRLPGLEPGQDAAGVSGPTSRRGSGHRRSGRRQIHRRAGVHRGAESKPLQDPLRALLLGLRAGPGAPDCRRHRAPEPEQEAASILICDEAHLLPHPALEQLPLLLNFDMDSARYLTLLLIGQPLLRRTLSLQMHEALRQRIGVHYHLEGLTPEELGAYLTQHLKAAGVSQPLFDETARQGMYQATKGIPRKINKLAMMALRLAAASKLQTVNEAILLDATAEALL